VRAGRLAKQRDELTLQVLAQAELERVFADASFAEEELSVQHVLAQSACERVLVDLVGDGAGLDENAAEVCDGHGHFGFLRAAGFQIDAVPSAGCLFEDERAREALIQRLNQELREGRRRQGT